MDFSKNDRINKRNKENKGKINKTERRNVAEKP